MRWLSFVCVAWLASLVCGNLLAQVNLPPHLRGKTAIVQRLAELYGKVIGEKVAFSLVLNGTRHWFTGLVEEVTLPDIRKPLETLENSDGEVAELRLKVSEVEADDPQVVGDDLPEIILAGDVNAGSPVFTDIFIGNIAEVSSEELGENISLVRLLAIEKGQEGGWQVLVEMESDGDGQRELQEPFITTLPGSAFLRTWRSFRFDEEGVDAIVGTNYTHVSN